MEAIGGGANVLAFVVLGIKSAKLTHDTLSAISDGPARVRNLAAGFLQLHWILEQLLQCRAAATDTALHGQARQCCLSRERATGRFWKRLKAAISESDLEKLGLWHATLTDVGVLSNAIYATRDGNEKIQQQIHSFGASMQTQFVTQTATIQGAAQSIMSSHNDGRRTLEAGLSSIQETIDATHSISSDDIRSMSQLLKEIKDRIAPEPKHNPEMTNSSGDDEHAMDEAAPGSDHKLLDSIDSLCSLINEKRDAVDAYEEDDDQAKSAIENLEELVQNLRGQKLPVSDPKSFGSDLARFGKWFGSGALSINSRVESYGRPLTRVVEQSQSFSEVDIGAGKIHLMVQKRKRAIDTADQDDDDTRAKKRCDTDWMMKLAFVPDRGQNNHMLLVSLTRQRLSTNSMTCISGLQINRVLPEGSLVFQLVEQGNLRGLKEMLQDGRASLQDHDEHGASLLFYSVQHPQVCKFLIDSGLDVDHVARSPGLLKFQMQALQVKYHDDCDLSKFGELQPIIECRRLLLRAGADPTLNVGDDDEPTDFLEEAIGENIPETIELAWNPEFLTPFADIKTYRTEWGKSPILRACSNDMYGYNWQCFRQLLKFGANIEDRDEVGRTCLHLCIQDLRMPSRNTTLREFEAIQYLVREGADPRAVDKHGRSVSDIAYTTGGKWGITTSYPGDLWDAVLHSCGYDIAQFRLGYRRRARYTTSAHNRGSRYQYGRHNFERLWEGRGVECPYWNDKPWPPLGPGEEDSDDESQDRECTCHQCSKYYLYVDYEEFESGSECDTEEDEEQTSSDDGSVRGCPHHFHVDQDEEESESDMGEAMSTGDVQSYWEETGTLPGFGEQMQGMPSENWQDSPDLGHSIVGTPRSLSMDLENPWL
ncbi:hypothetical protein MRS44_001742 [Fusarium solani]|uniref:uncharacterized protein n=1 Tax=Fusarium solani TaxID=169388 RepID=UPI0032C3E88C|nr:hypothetical protein MRS44_001742 [Fusarium solani]